MVTVANRLMKMEESSGVKNGYQLFPVEGIIQEIDLRMFSARCMLEDCNM